jgi:hypothetical protein
MLYYNNFINNLPSINSNELDKKMEYVEKELPFRKSLNTREYRKEFSDIKEYNPEKLMLLLSDIKNYLFYILIILLIIAVKLC